MNNHLLRAIQRFPQAGWLSITLALLLTACGGTSDVGTGGGGPTQAPDPPGITISALATTVDANPGLQFPDLSEPRTTTITVSLTTTGGTPIAEGTAVSLTTSNPGVGTVSTPDDPDTDDVNEFLSFFSTITDTTAGGTATFFFTSGETAGTSTLTASATDPATGTTVTASIVITVTAVDPIEQITITPADAALPVNTFGVAPFLGSPFLSEVTVQFTGLDGEPINPAGDSIGVSIAPVSVASFSTLDDPETEDINEFLVLLGQGPVDTVGGLTTLFVNSGSTPGTATLTVTATDTVTGANVSSSFDFTVSGGAANGIPASATVIVPDIPVFVQGINGTTTLPIDAQLLDAGGQPADVPAAAGQINNVMVDLVPPSPNGSSLSSTSATGVPVSGTSIAIQTTNGIANFAFLTGSSGGSHQITVTADAADNNVDNGIQSPVTASTAVIVGNGQLASVELTSELFAGAPEVSDLVMPGPVPGTLQLTLGVIASDSFGAPILANTELAFGKVDTPVTDGFPSLFTFSGMDGNPAEGGPQFTAATVPPDGFLDDPVAVDEAVLIGDTLVTFGDEVPGNAELEAARTVTDIVSGNSVLVDLVFNNNDGSGAIVDDGSVIPYVIGRSDIGNIASAGLTDASGTASVTLTYPADAIGQPLVLWVQGNRIDAGVLQTVADAASLVFPGQGPAVLALSPNSVPGNDTASVELCLTDVNGFAIANAALDFIVNGTFTFTVAEDPLVTGDDGCITTDVTSSGITSFGADTTVTFSGAGAEAELTLTDPMIPSLAIAPTALTLNNIDGPGGLSGDVVVSASLSSASPAGGVSITASCNDPNLAVAPASEITDAGGNATFTITVTPTSAMDDGSEVVGLCSFTGTVGSSPLTVSVGINGATGGVGASPPPP